VLTHKERKMPIVIKPKMSKMDKMGAGGMDIGRTPSLNTQDYDIPGIEKNPTLKKKMKKMAGKMEDMREYMDIFDGIEEDTIEEGAFKDMEIDVEDGMSKEEFVKEYPGMGDEYDKIKKEIMDRADETIDPDEDMQEQDIEMEDDCGCDQEAVDAMVSVPVQELQDILQLAGYENYAEKIAEYANEPAEDYMSPEDQLIGLSGGLNRPKKSYPASAPGDNPMDQEPREVEETMEAVEEKLYKSYKDFLEEQEIKVDEKITRGTGKKGLEKSLDKLYGPKKGMKKEENTTEERMPKMPK
tara:strand:+ start:10913 stop:11806 length:894 start_codon:yes stop_codon:yes gene_type:complete